MLTEKIDSKKGYFLVFEGIDGSGKSTQIKLLMNKLKALNIKCYETKEPTDAPIGALIHQIMTGRISTDNKVIAALFVADRLDHLLNKTDGICDKIDNGITTISDRYYFSSYAYHSIDMPMDWVIQANSLSADILRPTYTFFIDVLPEVAIERIQKERFHSELFETQERLSQVRLKYLEAFDKLKDKENIIIIDGNQSEELIAEEIWTKIVHLFLDE